MQKSHFESIVIGAGSAGCVTAGRLSAAGLDTLLIESGPSRLSLWQKLPLGVGQALKDRRRTWLDNCEPSGHLRGRALEWHAGRGLGGSSAVNGMLAVRGDPGLYDELEKFGVQGWSYEDCLPHFKAIERVRFPCSSKRGTSGPIRVTKLPMSEHSEAFHLGFNSLGVKSGDDYNSEYSTGVYQLQLTTSQFFRSDASRYLFEVANQSKLTLKSDSSAQKLLLDRNRIIGVEVTSRDKSVCYTADSFILCLGAVRTPILLEKSGIGNPEYLERAGIKAVHRLDAVGQNLKDHLMVRQTYESICAGTVNDLFLSKKFACSQLARYLIGSSNLFSTSSLISTAFVPVPGGIKQPRFRIQLGLSSAEGRLATNLQTGIDAFSGFHFGVYDISPSSTGSVHIINNRQNQNYLIKNNYLSTDDDVTRLTEGYALLDQLARTVPMKSIIRRRSRPNLDINESSNRLDYFASSGHTCWHPVGTCRMGNNSEDSVTGSNGMVHGLENLYIFDASIFPIHTSSNTNLPTLMAAEKLSSNFIKSRDTGFRRE